MSALPPKADIRPRDQDVCLGPKADIGVDTIVRSPSAGSLKSTLSCAVRAPREALRQSRPFSLGSR